MTARRLWPPAHVLRRAGTLVAAAALAPNPSDAAGVRQGGTLRLSTFSDVDHADPALAATSFSCRSPSRPARCSSPIPTSRARRARGSCRRSSAAFTVSRDGRIYTFDLEADLPLPHGRAGDRAELCGRDRANRRSEDEVTRRRLPRRSPWRVSPAGRRARSPAFASSAATGCRSRPRRSATSRRG